jgi:hypothetical protein
VVFPRPEKSCIPLVPAASGMCRSPRASGQQGCPRRAKLSKHRVYRVYVLSTTGSFVRAISMRPAQQDFFMATIMPSKTASSSGHTSSTSLIMASRSAVRWRITTRSKDSFGLPTAQAAPTPFADGSGIPIAGCFLKYSDPQGSTDLRIKFGQHLR